MFSFIILYVMIELLLQRISFLSPFMMVGIVTLVDTFVTLIVYKVLLRNGKLIQGNNSYTTLGEVVTGHFLNVLKYTC